MLSNFLQLVAINGVSLEGLSNLEALATVEFAAASPTGFRSAILRQAKPTSSLKPAQKRAAALHAAHAAASVVRRDCRISEKAAPLHVPTEQEYRETCISAQQQLRRDSAGRLLRHYKAQTRPYSGQGSAEYF